MRKTVCFALILLLLLLTPVSFAVTYPMQRGNVNDDADVLSDVTVKDIETMNDRFFDARFIVVTRHFLGGADVQDYSGEDAYSDGIPCIHDRDQSGKSGTAERITS